MLLVLDSNSLLAALIVIAAQELRRLAAWQQVRLRQHYLLAVLRQLSHLLQVMLLLHQLPLQDQEAEVNNPPLAARAAPFKKGVVA